MTKDSISIAYGTEFSDGSRLLGFKVKPEFENSPILLNTSAENTFKLNLKSSNSIFLEEVNRIEDFSDKIKFLESENIKISFNNYSNSIFYNNLLLIDTSLPQIIAEMALISHINQKVKLKEVVSDLKRKNPLKFDYSKGHGFYEYKIKKLLTEIALGMTDTIPWKGEYSDEIGYVITESEQKIICSHIYYKNLFQDYLFNNTKFETGSTGKHKFGKIYEKDGEFFFNLNLQIRFI